jgi:hypothetical protein
LLDDVRLNKEFYFDFQTTDYINFTVPYTCVLKEIVKSNTNANLTIVKVSDGSAVNVNNTISAYTQIKITSDIVTHVTLKVRLNDYI